MHMIIVYGLIFLINIALIVGIVNIVKRTNRRNK